MATKIRENVESVSKIKLEEPHALLLIEAARRSCLPQMITILSFHICKDAEQFTQISKQSSFTKFLSQIFGDEFDFARFRMQCDPLYYLQIANQIEISGDSIKMSNTCAKLFNIIFDVKERLQESVMNFLLEYMPLNNDEPIIDIQESLKREYTDTVSLQIRYCFLAVFANNLCAKGEQSVPFLVFEGISINRYEHQDSFLDAIPISEFFILTKLEERKNIAKNSHPWVVNFIEEELSDQRVFTKEQYEILKDYVMMETIQISYPNSLRPDLLAHLKQRMERKVTKILEGEFFQGKTMETPYELILTIIARRKGMEKLVDSNLAEEEQSIIQLFTQKSQINNTEALIQTDYTDDEYKCIFSFGNGLKAITWMLPNEYDSIKIQNIPGDELGLFEQFKLNQEALCSINKSGDAFIVKCKNKQLSVQFLKHIQSNDFVLDKTNRVIVKPVIIENLHTTVTRICIIVKYRSRNVEYDELKEISQCLDTLVKGEYEIRSSQQQIDLVTQEKTCYIIMESDERAEFVIQTLNGQQSEKIFFSSMKKEILKQGKLNLHIQVFKLFETILRNIKSAEFAIIFPNQTTMIYEETTVNLLHIEKKQVVKEAIRLLGKEQLQFHEQYQATQSADIVELLISGNSDKEISLAISELKILTRPKQVLQLKDSFQFLIFQDEKGREYLKNLSISNNLFIVFNSALNRLEFYSKTTAQKSKATIDTVTQSITDFIDNSLVNLRFSIKSDVSSVMVQYLRSKKFSVESKPGLIKTKIKYSLLIKEREFIKDNFLKGHEDEDCQICFGSSTIYQLSLCNCRAACKGCIKSHIRDAAISSLTDFKPEILCPICNKSPISINDINDIFDKVSLASIFKIRFKSSIEGLKYENKVPLFIGCQTPDCKGLLQINDQLKFVNPPSWRCLLCSSEFCIKHIIEKQYTIPLHEVHDKEITCLAQASDFGTEDLVKAGLLKQCPKCHSKFSHEEGCNHLTCPTCKCHFCAICDFYEETYKNIYNHLSEKHQGHSAQQPKHMKIANKEELERIQNLRKKDKSGESVIQDESVFKKFGIAQVELGEISISNLEGDPDLISAISFGLEKENCNFNTSDLFD